MNTCAAKSEADLRVSVEDRTWKAAFSLRTRILINQLTINTMKPDHGASQHELMRHDNIQDPLTVQNELIIPPNRCHESQHAGEREREGGPAVQTSVAKSGTYMHLMLLMLQA